MSGYGSADDHLDNIEAVVLNGIDVARASMPTGESAEFCGECDEPIPEGRRVAVPGCQYCIHCAPKHELKIRVRAVDWIL